MFKKLLAVAAVVATAACLSVSAFAAGETAALTQDKDAVTVTGYAAVNGATQYTVMLFNDTTSEIYYINQGTDPSALLTGMLFKATDGENVLPVGDYTVRIGNDAGAAVDVDLKVEEENNTTTITLNYGDVNGDGNVTGADASLIIQYSAKILSGFVDAETKAIPKEVGDVNGDGNVTGADASLVIQYSAKILSGFVDAQGNPLTTYTYESSAQ